MLLVPLRKIFTRSFLFSAFFLSLSFLSPSTFGQTAISPTTWGGTTPNGSAGASAYTPLPASGTPGSLAVNVSQWNRSGVNWNTAANRYNSRDWTNNSSSVTAEVTSGKYLTFTVTNDANTELQITGVSIGAGQASPTGPNTFGLGYKIGSGSLVVFCAPVSGPSPVFTGAAFTLCAGQTVTFYLCGWGGSSAAGTWSINNTATINASYITAVTATAGSNSPVAAGTPLNFTSAPLNGVLPYTYSWSGPLSFSSPSATPSISSPGTGASGTYSVVVTDNWGCQVQATTSVTVNPASCSGTPLAGTATPVTTSVCGSGSTTLNFTGGSPATGLTYQWSSSTANTPPGANISGAIATSYVISPAITATTYFWCTTTCTVSGLSNISTVGTVTVNPVPSSFSVTGGGAYVAGDIGVLVGLSNSTTGTSYQLYNGVSTTGSPVSGSTGNAISFGNITGAGTYTVLATAAGCTNAMSGSATVSILTPPVYVAGNLTAFLINGTNSNAFATTIKEYTTSGALASSFDLPNSGSAEIGNSGAASSDGQMTLDAERTHLIIPGYDAPAGTSNVVNSGFAKLAYSITGGTGKVAVRGANTNIFSSNNFRSATASGTTYYGVGSGSSGTAGVQLLGMNTNTQVYSTNASNHVINIFNGQLYMCSKNTSPAGIYTIGTGIPVSLSTGANVCASGNNSNAFTISPDGQTMYIADDGSGGIMKYTLSGSTFALSYNVTGSVSPGTTYRGVTADFSSTPYIIYATTVNDAGGNTIVKIVDNGSAATATKTTLATAPSGAIFRGITFAPAAYATISGTTGICSGSNANISFAGNPGCTVTYKINGGSPITVVLDNTGRATVNSGTLTNGGTTATTVTYTLVNVITSLGTATVSGNAVITVNPIPAAAITGITSVCPGFTTTLSNITPGGTWSSNNSSVASVNSGNGVVTGGIAGISTITYSNGCNPAATTTYTVIPTPGAISGASSVCSGFTIPLSDGIAGGVWSSSSSSIATVGSTSGVVGGILPGNAIITYSTGCGTDMTKTVTVIVAPGSISGASSVCFNQSITLSDGVTGGVWSSSNTAVVSVGSTSGVVTGGIAGNATITYSTGCGSDMTKTVTVIIAPGTISGASSVCSGFTIPLSDGIAGGVWSSSNSSIATVGSTSGVVGGILPGNAIITYSTGCGTDMTKTVTVIVAPGSISGASSVCFNQSIMLSDGVTGGVWSSSNTATASAGSSSGVVTGGTPGNTTITYSTGCGADMTKTVTVIAAPGTISGASSVCSGFTIPLSDGIAGGVWSSSNSSIATVGSTSGVVGGILPGNAIITYSTGCGTDMTKTVTVIVAPGSISGASSVCFNQSIMLSDGVTGGVWSSSNTAAASVGSSSGVVTGGTPGNTTITYSTGCGADMTKTVTVIAAPGTISGASSVCSGFTIPLSDGIAGGVWSSSNSSIATVGSTSGVVGGILPGNATITYSTGCGTDMTKTVTVRVAPGSISGGASMCFNQSITLSDGVTGGIWSSSNTAAATVGASNGIVAGKAGGNTVITYSTGCGVDVTKTVTVIPAPGSISGASSVCSGLNIQLSDGITGGVWSSSNTSVATVGTGSGLVTGGNAGPATISYSTGCGTNATALVTVNTVLPISGASTVCVNSITILSDAGSGTWSSNNTNVSISGAGSVTGVAVGTSIITYTTNAGCKAVKTFTVNALPGPITTITATTICIGSTTLLNDAGGGTWSSSNTNASVNVNTGVVTGLSGGTSIITYTLPNSCIATTTVTTLSGASAISGVTNICVGIITTLSDAPIGGAWSSSNSSIAAIGSGTGIVTGIASGSVVITYTLSSGCKVITPFTVNPLSPVSGNTTICAGFTTILSDATVGGTWSSSNTNVSVGPSGIVTGLAAGTAAISYNLPSGCTATTTLTILPLPSAITGNTHVCMGLVTTLTDAATGGAWSSSNTNIITVNSAGHVTGVSAGMAVITYTQGGCPATTTVTVDPLPSPIAGDNTICLGSAITLSDASAGTWSSSNANVLIGAATGIASGAATGTAVITYTTAAGCIATMIITVNPLPPPITGASNICVAGTISLTDNSPGGAWTSNNTSVATAGFASGIVTGVSAGTVVIFYQIITRCIITATITVNPLPLPITGAARICEGSATTLSDPSIGGVWSSGSTTANIDPVSGMVTGVSAGPAIISYTIGTGCVRTYTMTVDPLPLPIAGSLDVCIGHTTVLSDPTAGGSWSSGNTTVATIDPATGFVNGLAVGTAMITYSMPTGCIITSTLTVHPLPLAITGLSAVCEGAAIFLSDVITGGAWSSDNTAVATVNAVTGMVTGASAGAVTITYTSAGGCTVTTIVTVNPLPLPINGAAAICAGLTTTFSDATPGGTWSSATPAYAIINPVTGRITSLMAGTAIISYTLNTGCAATAILIVHPLPTPVGGNHNLCLGNTTILSDPISGGTWSSNNTGIADITPTTGAITAISLGTTDITYTSPAGCIGTTSVTVHPLPGIYAVTGGSSYCAGDSGVHIGINGSETSVNYLLYNGSMATGPVAGTGTALDLGLQTVAGTYSVVAVNTFTACSNNMAGNALVTIIPSVIPAVSILTGTGDTVCSGTPVTFAAVPVQGGLSPAYLWTVNGVGVGTGNTYSFVPADGDRVTVNLTSNAICPLPHVVSVTDTITVDPYAAPVVNISANPGTNTCQGKVATFTAMPVYGGTAPAFTWKLNGINVWSGNTYTYIPANGDLVTAFMVSNYLCRTGDTTSGNVLMTVDTFSSPSVFITASPGITIAPGQSDTFTAHINNGGSFPSYQWLVNGVIIPGATKPTFIINALSSHDSVTCRVVASGGCGGPVSSTVVILVNTSGVATPTPVRKGISILPNPNRGEFIITGAFNTMNDEEASVVITDMLGQVIYTNRVTSHSGTINERIRLNNVANGMYILNLGSATENKVFHIIIEQ